MGTRGLIGVYKDNKTKATYNHYDSYPSGIGTQILSECMEFSVAEMKKAFDKIILVNEDTPPTKKDIEEYKKYFDERVGTQKIEDWYGLLRKSQGTLKPYFEGKTVHMIDNFEFIHDSLFCEWAYIINLDEGTLEVYEGFQKNKNEHRNRYTSDYTTCKLVKTYKLNELPDEKTFIKDLEKEEDE